MRIVAEPLTAEAFKPFGAVLEGPPVPGRVDADDPNGRAHAPISLSVATVAPTKELPPRALLAELHPAERVALSRPGDARCAPRRPRRRAAPRLRRSRGPGRDVRNGHLASPRHRARRPASFAVLMWRDGTAGDEEFVPVTIPVTVDIP